MSTVRYPRVRPGEQIEIKAVFWNRIVDVLEWFDKTQGQSATNELRQSLYRPYQIIQVKNATESQLSAQSILAINGSLFDPGNAEDLDQFKTEPVFIGSSPNYPADIGRFVVLLEPLGPDSVGPAVISGVVACKVYMDYQDRPFADINELGITPTTHLVGNEFGGAELLYVEGENDDPEEWEAGEKHALVRLGDFREPPLIVSWSGGLTFGSTVVANVHDAGGSSERTITLYGSIIGPGAGPLGGPSDRMQWAHFHRESGTYELGANWGMMVPPPP